MAQTPATLMTMAGTLDRGKMGDNAGTESHRRSQPDMNIRTSTPMAIAPELCDNP
jgi:hypothetical protein